MELLETRVDVDDLDSFLARLDEIGSRHGVTIQAFDARYVADRRHLERAVALADRAVDRGENVARDRAVEILLYAAGRRQIDRALEMGLSPGENRAVILIEGEDEDDALADLDALEAVVDRGPTLGEYDEEVLCSFFGITDAERAATDADLEELVRERVALLEVAK